MHEQTVRVTIDSGTIEGFTRDGVHRWRSVPYARAPLGPLRFRAPQTVQPWPGVRYCHEFGYCAPQQRKYTMIGVGKYQPMSEDCLTLNVTAPESPTERLPVMVFIHGGAYILGSSATPLFDGAALALRGCVYVSVNYRLGALGCLDLSSLSTPDNPIDGNLYLRDLVMALRWVRDNIAVFGGDPDAVTIFGESTGAHAVTTLLAVPAAKGLFAQAISQSPPSGLVRSPEAAETFAVRFAGLLGTRPEDAAAVLMAARPAELVSALDGLTVHSMKETPGAFPAGPVSETDYLPIDPVAAMRQGKAHRVPLIVGNNADEARLFTRFLTLLPTTQPMIEMLFADADAEVRERIIGAYPDYPSPAACLRLSGDFAVGSAVWQIADAHSGYAPTYVYRYDYAPRTLRWSGFGATHGTELFAVFDMYRTGFGKLLTAAADRRSALRVSDDMQSKWHEFSRTGIPPADWPHYTRARSAVMVFDRRPRVEYDPHADRRQAWDGFSPPAR
jgi:para-nitrobenzyl esterase